MLKNNKNVVFLLLMNHFFQFLKCLDILKGGCAKKYFEQRQKGVRMGESENNYFKKSCVRKCERK